MIPADESTVEFMRTAHFRLGDRVTCEITMVRSPVFFRAIHKLARMLINNTDTFHGKREHDVIKRLQSESAVWCDVYRVDQEGSDEPALLLYVPKSVAFGSMDEAEFRAGFDLIADYVAATYWPGFDLSLLDEED